MGERCKQQCEQRCQVWQLAVGGESNPNVHLHMPCEPGGGRPGGGLTRRTYEGGCRSACSGSVRHPVQHMYPAGRVKKWFIDTKEWFWDGIFVMKTENPTKSASHYCLPFPRPTMRLPRSTCHSRTVKSTGLRRVPWQAIGLTVLDFLTLNPMAMAHFPSNNRLVEVHHVHPPPSAGVQPDLEGTADGMRPPSSAETTMAQIPLQEGLVADGSDTTRSLRADPTGLQASAADGAEPGNATHEDHPPKAEAEKLPPKSPSDKGVRISHINVRDGFPQPVGPGDAQPQGGGTHKDPGLRTRTFTYIDYGASLVCTKLCRRGGCPGTGCFPCIPAQWKFLIRRGFVFCFTRTAGVCLCLSSSCATCSFCLRKVARTVDAVATTAVDVKELASAYVFIVDMPGLKHSEIKVQVENDSVLKISGDRRDDFPSEMEVKYVRLERSPGKFMRKFNLPGNTYLDGISAACQYGLLTVTVPQSSQPEPYRPRSFDVDVSPTSISPT